MTASHYYGYGPLGYPVFEKYVIGAAIGARRCLCLDWDCSLRTDGRVVLLRLFWYADSPVDGRLVSAVWFSSAPGIKIAGFNCFSALCAFVLSAKAICPYDSVGPVGRGSWPVIADEGRCPSIASKIPGCLVFVWWNMKDLKLKRLSLALLCVGMIAFYFAFIASATNFYLTRKIADLAL